jgi:hypothetical protein
MLPGEARHTFRGYNDNFPAMAALTTLVAGPLLGIEQYVGDGLDNLRSMQDLLLRRGVLSEYSSPTYTPITMTCLAEIAELSPIPEARALALQGEHRCWIDLCSRFHPATSIIAGPYSRAYNPDLCGHVHNAHMVLFLALGDEVVPINPLTALFPYRPRQIRHGGGHDRFIQAHAGWQSTPTYHIPDLAIDLALNKRHPTTVRASSEQASFPRNVWSSQRHPVTPLAELAASPMHLYTHLDRDFAFGCQDRMFLDGFQATPFHAIYAKHAPARRLEDVRTLFPRYVIGDTVPTASAHVFDAGRGNAVAHGAAALVLYRARPAWGANAVPDHATTPVSSLKLALTLPVMYGTPDEVRLGDTPVTNWSERAVDPCPVFIRDGNVYIAIHPLLACNYGRSHAVECVRHEDFAQICFVNYRGTPRTFTDAELLEAHNGFVVEMSQAAGWPSFDAFCDAHAKPTIHDTWHAADAMRRVRYQREGLSLGMEISPVSEGIKHRTANGRIAPEPKLDVEGFDLSAAPWF